MTIPLVAVEEHHEAFFVWYHARQAGWIGDADNILLHVDDHADLRLPLFHQPVPRADDLVAAAELTYTHLDIARFIWPAVYAGIFNKVYWLRRKHDAHAGSWRRVTLKFSEDRTRAAWTKTERLQLEPIETASGEVACEYAPLVPGDRLRPSAPLALDIDLDYFTANYPPDLQRQAIRVDESFAREMLEDPYHWMRVEGNVYRVVKDPDGAWAIMPREERVYLPRPRDERAAEDVIAEALDRLGTYLDEFNLQPAVITLCRSEYSGYTPKSLVRHIEQGVRRMLEARYDIAEHSLNSLLPAAWKIPAHRLRVWPW